MDLEWLLAELKGSGSRNILIQSPLGLRNLAEAVSKALREAGFITVLSGSRCWGGCDIAYREAEALGIDTIIHMGHTPFMRKDRVKTIYLECRYEDPRPLEELIPALMDELGGIKRIGLAASIQWLSHIPLLAKRLEKAGKTTLIARPGMFSQYTGQVLGCDYSSIMTLRDDVEAFIVLGSLFHGLGAALLSDRKTVALDPFTRRVSDLKLLREQILRQRYGWIVAFSKCRRVGVVGSVKPGQARFGLAGMLLRVLRSSGLETDLISADEVDANLTVEYAYEGYINTACPRLSIEDQSRFSKPFLLPMETLVALGLIEWEYVLEKGLLMYPWGWNPKEGEIFWKIIRGERISSEKRLHYPEISCAL